MKNIQVAPENPKFCFTVTKKDINNHNTLLPAILYREMQKFASTIIANNAEVINAPAKLYKLDILKNAFLNDTLVIQSKIKKFNTSELQLELTAKHKGNKPNGDICMAIFKFQLKNNILKAS